MNKTQLVDALAARTGDRRTAAAAVDGMLETIVDTVASGGTVSITGFGVFEPRARAARVARNPRTGETVQVAATTVPAFRPGAGFRTAVGGAPTPSRAAPARRRAAARTGEVPATRSGMQAKATAPFVAQGAADAPKASKPSKAAKGTKSSENAKETKASKSAKAVPGVKAAATPRKKAKAKK